MSDEEYFYPVVSDNLPKHIKKGHQLVFSRQDLSAREADMFALMIAHMKANDWERSTPHYEFTSHQLSEWLGVESKHIGSNLSPVANRLASRKIGIKIETGKGDIEFDYRPLFKHIAYKNGTLTMVPNDMLKSEYIEYNQGFALINTRNFFDVKKNIQNASTNCSADLKTKALKCINRSLMSKGSLDYSMRPANSRKTKAHSKINSVFMKRCIRESIKELTEHPQIRKELLFLEGENGEKGFEVIKKGRTITGIKFLFRWIKLGTIEELNQHDALKTIRELELKRLQDKIKLTEAELEALAIAYRYIGKEQHALKVEESLSKRHLNREPEVDNSHQNEVDSLLDKIDTLSEISDNPDY
ncbi:LOW QUALITY PROTEIN: replication protein [Vibrio sp. JCM 19052]|nr:LOW QUALITY PROTEIN: replication protein [Vibrio sp. JCM 19052]